MKEKKKVVSADKSSKTGIEELDTVLGGGFPKDSTILLAGSSGSGKTIFCFQWLFEGIRNQENGVYISVTEPLFKTLKNVETMSFYDRTAIEDERLKILDIREIYKGSGFDQERTLNFIEKEVMRTNAKRLCIDSITAIAYNIDNKAEIRKFIFELGQILATLGCTCILTSEVSEEGRYSAYGVEEFISDSIVRLDRSELKEVIVRRMQIAKVRGRGYSFESLPFKITTDGIEVFPKFITTLSYSSTTERLSTGNKALDGMLQGGLFTGSSTYVLGSTGTGKSLFGLQFLKEGLEQGEPCLYAGFEESREQVLRNAKSFGWNLEKYEKEGLLQFRCVYPSETSIEQHMAEITRIVDAKGVKRCVVDSLSSVYGSIQQDAFTNFVKLIIRFLKSKGVTSLFTAAESDIRLTSLTESHTSVLFDNIIKLRNVEMEGELQPVMNIIKVRGSGHSKGLRRYDITDTGIILGQPLVGYEGITTGVVRKVSETTEEKLKNEFKRFIGPLGNQAYIEVSQTGIDKDTVSVYIDKLARQGVMKAADAALFKERVIAIIEGEDLPENEEKPIEKRRGVFGGFLKG